MPDDDTSAKAASKSLQQKLDEINVDNDSDSQRINVRSLSPKAPPIHKALEPDIVIDENDELPEASDSLKKQSKDKKLRRNWKEKLALHWPPKKKEYITGAVVLLICFVAVGLLISNHGKKPVVAATAIIQPTKNVVKSNTVASTLSGLQVTPAVNQTPVTGVMIENSDEARPQSGLSQASVVFEALAEGGITRFLALYQDQAPSNIGPIRSVRPYYLQWALGFDASIAHVGGSSEALADISTWHVKNLDESYNAGSYHRISTREAPHNVYTSIADLNSLEQAKGFTTTDFTGFPRKADQPSNAPSAKSIEMNPSWADYATHYDYDSATNSYNLSEDGTAMVDANTSQQLSPKVLVAMIVPLSQGALDTTGAYYSDYNVLGTGKAYVFQDGNVTIGNWTKQSNTSQIKFTDSTGKNIALNAGQTWITALSSSGLLTYNP